MATLQSAVEFDLRQRNLTALAVAAARKAQGTARLTQVVTAFQLLAARDGVDSVGTMLAEQNITADQAAAVNTAMVAGVASDGRPLGSLLTIPNLTDLQFGRIVATQVQDAARMGLTLGITSRPRVTGYVRMLVQPSCSRCIILAGKRFRWNRGFQRHPRCDCKHIPTSEATAGDLTTSPGDAFESMSRAEQDRIFGARGAEAIRLGADPSKVVNAHRGMYTAQFGAGRSADFTREGTTVRGWYGGGYGGSQPGQLVKQGTDRYRSSTRPRAMPETIIDAAQGDRSEALRLLRINGYLVG